MTEEEYSWMENLSWNDLKKALIQSYNTSEDQRDKLEALKSWYETRLRKYEEQIEAAKNPPIDIVQSVVSGILLKGLEGLGEILEAED